MTVTVRNKLPAADDEYTSEQRRIIDGRLAEARKGPYYGPFETADEAIKFLRKEIRSRKTVKPKPSSGGKWSYPTVQSKH